MLEGERAHALEVAGRRRDDARVHHHRLHDHPGDLTAELGEHGVEHFEVVERHDRGEIDHRLRDARPRSDARGSLVRAELIEVVVHRHHHRVVMAVIAALDLHDAVAAADRAHQMHRVHRRLGAAVAEPPERKPEPRREVLGHRDRVIGRLREVRTQRDATLHGVDDRRMRVADEHHAVAAVQVDVLGAVDVPHPRALAVAHPHRARPADHPARRRAAGEHLLRLAQCAPPTPVGERGTPAPLARSGRRATSEAVTSKPPRHQRGVPSEPTPCVGLTDASVETD